MVPLIGYANRLSLRPGETIEFKVSSAGSEPFQASLARIICADPNPAGPGMREVPQEAAFAGSYPSRQQDVQLGSYGRVPAGPGLTGATLLATVWPTTPDKGLQGVLSGYDPATGRGLALAIGEDGSAAAVLGRGDAAPLTVSCGIALRPRRWYRIWVAFDPESRRLSVGQAPLDPHFAETLGATTESKLETGLGLDAGGAFHIAALGGSPVAGHYNGKIELPQVYSRPLDAGEVESAARGAEIAGLAARWDFSHDISGTRLVDEGVQGLHGSLVNMPARAMTGSNWTGRETCWRHAPDQYGAIHFHDDDIHDCGWETDFSFTVPHDMKSGAYAAKLTCGGHADAIPFFVCPPKGKRQADICLVIPTFTYVIYANHARLEFGEAWRQRARDWQSYPWNPAEHQDYGLSTYNFHSDGSGICHASSLRPILTLRPGYFSITDERGSGLRHFQADSHILDWLEAKGYSYDILTDGELHEEGAAVLQGYPTVLTSTHPEYHTQESLDAFRDYRDGGGHLVYLGGNGFYWRVALHREQRGVIEIRRAEGGIRAWAAEPGEYYNAFDGNYGGLWRRNGRPPQDLTGIGFTSQGLFEGSYYRKRPEAADPGVAWIFDGVEDDILGDFGLSGGGAAGYELDRADPKLGTPEGAVVVASSEGHDPETFVLVPEEHLTHVATWSGEPQADLIRADMTYLDHPGGGAVFSTGSITFCGSLAHNGYDNNISRILSNVVERFTKA